MDVRGNVKTIKKNGVILHQYSYDELGRLLTSNNEKYIYDTNGKLIATYGSFVLFNDFTIKISNESTIDPNTLLMIFCSYYSDQAYDN